MHITNLKSPFVAIIAMIMLLGPLMSASAYAALSRQPYLQSVSDSRVVLRWRTTTSSTSRVSYGTSVGSLNTNMDQTGTRTDHEVVITGLTPDTQYFYSVGPIAGPIEAGNNVNYFFKTAPPVGSSRKLRIWAIGDPGTGTSQQRAVRNAYTNLNATENVKTDVILTLGDNAYNDGTDSQYTNNFFNVYDDLLRQAPVWATRGNHERNLSAHQTAFTHPMNAESGGISSGSELYYSFDYGNIHFVCLDSFTSSNLTGNAMYTWLENDLASTTQKWIIAFWHHPPYSRSSAHDSDRESGQRVTRERANPILESYGVDLQLGGHNHFYSRTVLINNHYGLSSTYSNASHAVDSGNGRENGNGVYQKQSNPEGAVYVLAGSSGKIGYTPINHPANFTENVVLGSMVIDVEGDRMDVRMLRENGAIQDFFTITKTPTVNQPPAFSADPIAKPVATEGIAYLGSLATEASDPDGDTLGFARVSGPAWLAVAVNGGLSGTPGSGDVGVNSFVVEVTDSGGLSATATLEFTVNAAPPVNMPPAFSADPIAKPAATEDIAYLGSLTTDASDPDGDALGFTRVSGPVWLAVAANGNLSGTPGIGDVGANSFVVRVMDPGGFNDTATLNISVIAAPPINNPPAFTGASIGRPDAIEGIAYLAGLAADASDPDGDTLSFSKVSGPGWLLVATNGAVTGTPGSGDVGANSFIVQVMDADGLSDTATLTVNVTAAMPNRPPAFTTDPVVKPNVMENSAYTNSLVTDVFDADGDVLTFSKLSGPAWLLVANDGGLSGTPGTGDVGANSFSVQVLDPDGLNDSVTLLVSVDAMTIPNRAPIFSLDPITKANATENTVYLGSSLQAEASDPDGDPVTFSKVSGPAWLLVATDGSLSGTPGSADLGENSFVVRVSDPDDLNASATLMISVDASTIPNRAPAFTLNPILKSAATENSSYAGSLAAEASDPDGDVLSFVKVSGPAWLLVAANGALSGTPGASDIGSNSFEVQVSDPSGLSDNASLLISVDADTPANRAPAFAQDPLTKAAATESSAYTASLAADASDPDGDALIFAKISGPAWLIVELDGSLSGIPGSTDLGLNQFEVQVTDTGSLSATATLGITVSAAPSVNLAPSFTRDPIDKPNAAPGKAYSGSLIAQASDPDGDALVFSKLIGPGWLKVAANGSLSGTPDNGDEGVSSFVVQVMDAGGLNDTAVLRISVVKKDDAGSLGSVDWVLLYGFLILLLTNNLVKRCRRRN